MPWGQHHWSHSPHRHQTQTDRAVKMRLLLLAVVLVHGLQAQEKQQPDVSKLSGTWYTSSLASNNSALIAPGGPFRVFLNSMDVDDSSLTGHILVPTDSQCYGSSLVALKTDAEWFYLEFWGRNKLYIADVVADKFLVLYVINEQEGVTSLVAGLFARSPVAEQESLDRFESICEDLGLGKEQIVFLEDTDRCQEFRA
ncbi:minor allergen Can f 2-like [Lemur catta]|uniref:minor allergen Can f 2-like n=1 Tax=Lemur catta TaxID=9447 RepID=UPI001E26B515|nr:minor allergen Can f 2-like [Lemur catta]XP_045418017.1 minor allergen Can f 2-like [Lemur catta]